MRRKTPTLTIAIDLGTSLVKSIYQIEEDEGQPRALMMQPELLKVSRQALVKHLNDDASEKYPEENAWIQTKGLETNKIILVGATAREMGAIPSLRKNKYEIAEPKILAVVGAIVVKEKLPLNLNLNLALLLPWNERQRRDKLQEKLKELLSDFSFQGTSIKVKLKSCHWFPEGYGGLLGRAESLSSQWLEQRKIGILMFGRRNLNFLLIQQGQIKKGLTKDLGFTQVLEEIVNRTIGKQIDEELEEIIYKVKKYNKHELLLNLIRSQEKANLEEEFKQIKESLTKIDSDIWEIIKNSLDEIVPTRLHEMQIYGGTAQYYRKELSAHYSWTATYWGDELIPKISLCLNNLFLNSKDKDDLVYRFMDCYGAFRLIKIDFKNISTKIYGLKKMSDGRRIEIRYQSNSKFGKIISSFKNEKRNISQTIKDIVIAYQEQEFVYETLKLKEAEQDFKKTSKRYKEEDYIVDEQKNELEKDIVAVLKNSNF